MRRVNFGNRGKAFEDLLDFTNLIYERKGIALINKRPTPTKVIRTKGNRITQATYASKSTVDYDGVYKGRAIAFEAKSTKGKNLSLSNITTDQVEFLGKAEKHGAISFLIVHMKDLNETYIVTNKMLQEYVKNAENGARKSIPISDMEDSCKRVINGNGVPLDYLKHLK